MSWVIVKAMGLNASPFSQLLPKAGRSTNILATVINVTDQLHTALTDLDTELLQLPAFGLALQYELLQQHRSVGQSRHPHQAAVERHQLPLQPAVLHVAQEHLHLLLGEFWLGLHLGEKMNGSCSVRLHKGYSSRKDLKMTALFLFSFLIQFWGFIQFISLVDTTHSFLLPLLPQKGITLYC